MRVLLVQMPFFRLDTPSIGLKLLEAALDRAGFECRVEHLNLEFGRRVDRTVYCWIAGSAPRYLLFGDLVFARSLNGSGISPDALRALVARLDARQEAGVPERIVELFPELVEAAEAFLDDEMVRVDWQSYDLVGFGTVFNVVPPLAMARRVKGLSHPPAVILGGSNCEGELGEWLHRQFPFIDYVCRGEGERLVVELARTLAGNPSPLESIVGLVWREAGRTRCNGGRARLDQGCTPPLTVLGHPEQPASGEYPLDLLPVPRYDDWLERARTSGLLEEGELRLPFETSRGCWYGEKRRCLFCGFNGEAMAFRRKSPRRILDELEQVMSHRVEVLHCVDNIIDYRYFDTLLPELAKLDHGCEIFWEIRASLTRAQLDLLRRSGIVWLQAGVESLSTPILRMIGKGLTAFQNVRLLRYAAELELGVGWNFLFGFPGESPEDYRAMAELLPGLAHLQPPHTCYQVRIDRFSPMFERRDGFRNVRPAPSYSEIFPFDPETVARLAYYFEYDYVSQPDPRTYAAGCVEAVERWKGEVGQAALISFASGSSLHVVDSRAAATQTEAVLRGQERDVLRACEHGASLPRLLDRVEGTPREVESALAALVARRWVASLDGKYLSLPVPMDSSVPPGMPGALVRDGLKRKYCRRLARLRHAFAPPPLSGERPQPTGESG